MRALVVGGDGLIGRAVLAALRAGGAEVTATTRRPERQDAATVLLDLAQPLSFAWECEVAFFCAGIAGFAECEGNAESWRINVDGVAKIGKALMRRGALVVYVSTNAVEWSNSAYARQRAQVEVMLFAAGDPIIVRASKVSERSASSFAAYLIALAERHEPGFYHWDAP